jgi:hypothetical protein
MSYAIARKDLAIKNAKGARLALLVMFLDTLLFDWP